MACIFLNDRMNQELEHIRDYYYDYESPNESDAEDDRSTLHSSNEPAGATGFEINKFIPVNENGDQAVKGNPLSVVNNIPLSVLDRNRNDGTLVYVVTSDDADQLDPPLDLNTQELFENIQAPDTMILVAPSNEISNEEQSSRNPVDQDRLADRHLLEGEPVVPGETNTNSNALDVATSTWRRALKLDSDLLDYAQAEGGWLRKKVDQYNVGPSHETELSNNDDVLGLGPGILTTILEPVNRFVSSLISPDESRILLVEPDEALQLAVEDYNDNDQQFIQAEMNRLTRPRSPGIASFLDFCQAEGSPHPPRNANKIPATSSLQPSIHASLNSSGWIDDTEKTPLPTDEELEEEEKEEYAKLAHHLVAGTGPAVHPVETETDTESEAKLQESESTSTSPGEIDQNATEMNPDEVAPTSVEEKNDPVTVSIDADMPSSPTASPGNIRQTITAGGIPLELNINLTLTSCCHHASGADGNCGCNRAMTKTRDTSAPARQPPDITESQGEHMSCFIAEAMGNLITLSKY